jgi:hypothetical protein
MMLFEEHHKWKVMIWLVGSSPSFPSNLGMSEGHEMSKEMGHEI